VLKLLVGILKGAVIGGALGYGAFALANATGFGNPWLTYGLIGAIVGLFVGKPIWSLIRSKESTTWIAVLKSIFGFGLGCGLYAIVAKAWGGSWYIDAVGQDVLAWPPTLGGAIGAVYGGFVELDDAIGEDKTPPAKKDQKQIAKK
jgi:hypothetical protein